MADREKTKEPLPQRPRGPHPYFVQIGARRLAVVHQPSGADDACVLCGYWTCRCDTVFGSNRVLTAVA
ncbi:hypothetical protein [Streptomyces sp. NBC_00847]|uniref:hypothetical protein n=1 Tax=Streptomyces sp. NBC_00847 TaxID=2975850 RepID=UPI00225E4C8E|nr:hypothetical protein [Streptomyces sp. NBC_00847]MCX4885892.1 hypothetical protein [Streptomyces sp. NBC_00847]